MHKNTDKKKSFIDYNSLKDFILLELFKNSCQGWEPLLYYIVNCVCVFI